MEAEVVLKVVTGKEVGGWTEAGRRGIPGLSHPNTVEARDRFRDSLGHSLPKYFKSGLVESIDVEPVNMEGLLFMLYLISLYVDLVIM